METRGLGLLVSIYSGRYTCLTKSVLAYWYTRRHVSRRQLGGI